MNRNTDTRDLVVILAEREAKARNGNWVPANGGTETVITARTGKRMLYCWQPSTGDHKYMDVDADVIMSDEDAFAHLGA